ncbi:MAG: hypothetical protein ACRDYV_20935, partial [Acidimicrobiia bacterium]
HTLREALDDAGGQVTALGELLGSCRTRLRETLGPAGWEIAQGRARAMTVDEAIVHALSALRGVAGGPAS